MIFCLSIIENEDDRDWLNNVYRDYKGWMLKVAYHYTKNEEDAKDTVQEMFFRMAKNITSVPRDAIILKVYMETAIRNYCFTMLKKRNNHPIFSLEEQYSIESDENLEYDTVNKIAREEILNFIEQMPVNYSSVLTMYFVCENKISDISDILGIPYKTVESTLYRGRKMIKERFKDLKYE